jgi:hypothetical protein
MPAKIKPILIPSCVRARGGKAAWIYAEAIAKGNKPGFAEMLAMQEAPAGQTESTFLANFGKLADQFDNDDRYVNTLVEAARANGYNPSPNDVYMPTIANKMGDPRAFIKSRGEAKKVAEERGSALTINGKTEVEHRQPEDDPFDSAPKLAENLIAPEVVKAQAANPKLSAGEAREMVIDKHGSK